MDRCPRISIVTPSYNQARFIAETIESVMAQGYPDLEHIVVDGGSTDDTIDVLKRYPHLKWISKKDRGQGDALNKGFRLATGQIWGFLNSDDTLLPGAVRRVAEEIAPERGRHVIMGRCRFVDESGRYAGIEHPSHFRSHLRVLEVWKGHTIPQPAVFWTPEVWRTCGEADTGLTHLDYDLFCRFSRRYRFHFVDQVLATYRLHAASKTEGWTERDRLEDSIRISRRYWGSPLSPRRWRLELSLALHRLNRTSRGVSLLRGGRDDWRRGRVVRAALRIFAGAVLAPDVVFFVAVYPPLRSRTMGIARKILDRIAVRRDVPSQTRAYLDFTGIWEDGWAGPVLVLTREAPPNATTLVIEGTVSRRSVIEPIVLTASIDGREIGRRRIEASGDFSFELPLAEPSVAPGPKAIEVKASAWFATRAFSGESDGRPLVWKPKRVEVR